MKKEIIAKCKPLIKEGNITELSSVLTEYKEQGLDQEALEYLKDLADMMDHNEEISKLLSEYSDNNNTDTSPSKNSDQSNRSSEEEIETSRKEKFLLQLKDLHNRYDEEIDNQLEKLEKLDTDEAKSKFKFVVDASKLGKDASRGADLYMSVGEEIDKLIELLKANPEMDSSAKDMAIHQFFESYYLGNKSTIHGNMFRLENHELNFFKTLEYGIELLGNSDQDTRYLTDDVYKQYFDNPDYF